MINWSATATHRFTISVKYTQSWKSTTTTTQTTKKQYWHFASKIIPALHKLVQSTQQNINIPVSYQTVLCTISSARTLLSQHYMSFVQMQDIYMTKSGQDATKWNSRRILPWLFLFSLLGTKWNHSKMTCEWKNLSHNLLYTVFRRDWVRFSQVTASICKIQCKELKYANVFRVFSIFAKYLWNLSRL